MAGQASLFIGEEKEHRKDLPERLASIVGRRHVLTRRAAMRRFTRGYRYGEGPAAAVVLPADLVEFWRVLQACAEAGAAVIAQAANTGLTGGSTPFGTDYGGRPVVVVNVMRIKALHVIGGGRQVIAFPGSTLDELERALKPFGREPHSVIGSSCLGASVIGGICNNSGGALIRRGPAYTELALFARMEGDGSLRLVNHLGIDIGAEPEEMLRCLERGTFRDVDIDWASGRAAADPDYRHHVRDIEADSPARFNADPRRLFEASGSAGKVIVFAVRLDTFEAVRDAQVHYVGTNDPAVLTALRRRVLAAFEEPPIAAEYLHRDAFDIAEAYGKDTYLLIRRLGTGRLPRLFALKSRVDALAERLPFLPRNLSDSLLQMASRLLPPHLPARLRDFRDRFEHHLMIRIEAAQSARLAALLDEITAGTPSGHFLCTPEEGAAAFLHRFATAGAAVRYRAVHGKSTGGIVALDMALPRNAVDWVERLPADLDRLILKKLYYGHFFCHVFHQDYIVRPGVDWLETEHRILAELERRQARCPAEHNVGHLYRAEEALEAHYRALDPCNCFNPGIGKTSRLAGWR